VITHYGIDVLIGVFLILLVIIIGAFTFFEAGMVRSIVLIIVIVVGLFTLNFFRDPNRITPNEPNIIVSPADGKVVQIIRFKEDEFLHCNAIQVSIFMSPLDVHVNRFPISGTIRLFRHIPGKHLVAFEDKSSALNERTHIGIERNGFKVLFKQIAGTVARRIVADLQVGQTAVIGERFGMIKFGSRVDVIMPAETIVTVALNDRVRAGESILGKFSSIGEEVPQ
jgi:phosphatidylserine decarboxylase